MRRDAPGTSGHVTAKSSICGWGAFCKSGIYAAKVTCLTPGGLSCVKDSLRAKRLALIAGQKSAEGIVGKLPPKARTMGGNRT